MPAGKLCSGKNWQGNLVLFMAVLANSKRTFAPSGRGGIVYGRHRRAPPGARPPAPPPAARAPRRLPAPPPSGGREPLLRQEAALVVHLVRAAHPIAEIDVGKPHP